MSKTVRRRKTAEAGGRSFQTSFGKENETCSSVFSGEMLFVFQDILNNLQVTVKHRKSERIRDNKYFSKRQIDFSLSA